jgi:hypothetical protein
VPKVELSGRSIVGVGSFNPAIFQPSWLVENGLLPRDEAASAPDKMVVTNDITAYAAGWLNVQVTQDKAVFSTVAQAQEPALRDLVVSIFELLPHTPISAIGVNYDAHFAVGSDAAWHRIGDIFLPKEKWEPLFKGDNWLKREGGLRTGLLNMTVHVSRSNEKDFVRVTVAPSTRIPSAVYVGINAHFQLADGAKRSNALAASTTLRDSWDETTALQLDLVKGVSDWTT